MLFVHTPLVDNARNSKLMVVFWERNSRVSVWPMMAGVELYYACFS